MLDDLNSSEYLLTFINKKLLHLIPSSSALEIKQFRFSICEPINEEKSIQELQLHEHNLKNK